MEPSEQWTVVLIDDEKDIRDVVRIALEDADYIVHTAADGREGLQRVRDTRPEIVITDIRMPVMDGLAVLDAVKKEFSETEVIIITAFADIELAIRALQLDASDFVTKPLNYDALHLALHRAIQRFTSRKQLKDYMQLLERDKTLTARELVRSINFQRKLIESSMDAIAACDVEGRIILANRSMEQLTGVEKDRLISEITMARLFPENERARMENELDSDAFGGRNCLSLFETVLFDAGKRRIPVQVSAIRLFENDRFEGLVLFIRDLREFYRLERAMEDQARILQQDKMISLGRLAASVVHEINNPLSGILNYVRLMRRAVDKKQVDPERLEKFSRYLEIVDREISRCSHITGNLLAYTRKSPPSFETVSIKDLLEQSTLLCSHKLELQKIGLSTDIPTGLPAISGDFNQLQQCFLNLVFNAIDAMPGGGHLSLSLDYDPAEKNLILDVGDTGPGIKDKDLPRIFEPFYTTKQEGYGVGLGLSTVKEIMQRHGGDVRVKRTDPSGTVFRLELPVSG